MIRRQIFSKAKLSGLAGVGYCHADPDGNPSRTISTLSGFVLDGTGSYSTLGTISTYLWQIISSTLSIVSPTSSTTALTGTLANGDMHAFRLTVTDSLGNTHSAPVVITISIAPASQPSVTYTPDNGYSGTLNFSGGQIGDVLEVKFALSGSGEYPLNSPDAIQFTGITSVGDLSYSKATHTATVTLGASGVYDSAYAAEGENFNCNVRITKLNGAIYSKVPENSTTIEISTGGIIYV